MAISFRWMRLFVFILSFSAAFMSDKQNWFDGVTNCNFTEDDVGLKSELEQKGLKAQATYMNSVFEDTGCFWISDTILTRLKKYTLTTNSTQNCLNKCENDTQKIGIKLNICVCLKLEDKISGPVFKTSCEKEHGGPNVKYFQIYQHKIEKREYTNHSICMSIVKPGARSRTILKSIGCQHDYILLCNEVTALPMLNLSTDGTTTDASKQNKTKIELTNESSFMTTVKNIPDIKDKEINNVTTESLVPSVSTVEETTVEYNITTHESSSTASPKYFNGETSIFIFQIGLAIGLSLMVVVGAVLARYISRPKRGRYSFPDDDKADLAVGEDTLNHNSRIVLHENYSNPWDEKLLKDRTNEHTGESALTSTNNPTTQVPSEELENEYQHLDFTMRKEKSPKFLNDSEYGYERSNTISVFDQPWDDSTSKMTRLFSHIRQTVVQRGRHLRNSIFKPNSEGHNGSTRESYIDNETNSEHLTNNMNGNISRENSSSPALRCKHKDNSETVDRSFQVLPFSERIEVSSTNVYAEPDDCRKSLRDRLLHIVSVKPFRFDFGPDSGGLFYSNRRTRCKSKIYSLAKPIQEIDESEV